MEKFGQFPAPCLKLGYEARKGRGVWFIRVSQGILGLNGPYKLRSDLCVGEYR